MSWNIVQRSTTIWNIIFFSVERILMCLGWGQTVKRKISEVRHRERERGIQMAVEMHNIPRNAFTLVKISASFFLLMKRIEHFEWKWNVIPHNEVKQSRAEQKKSYERAYVEHKKSWDREEKKKISCDHQKYVDPWNEHRSFTSKTIWHGAKKPRQTTSAVNYFPYNFFFVSPRMVVFLSFAFHCHRNAPATRVRTNKNKISPLPSIIYNSQFIHRVCTAILLKKSCMKNEGFISLKCYTYFHARAYTAYPANICKRNMSLESDPKRSEFEKNIKFSHLQRHNVKSKSNSSADTHTTIGEKTSKRRQSKK